MPFGHGCLHGVRLVMADAEHPHAKFVPFVAIEMKLDFQGSDHLIALLHKPVEGDRNPQPMAGDDQFSVVGLIVDPGMVELVPHRRQSQLVEVIGHRWIPPLACPVEDVGDPTFWTTAILLSGDRKTNATGHPWASTPDFGSGASDATWWRGAADRPNRACRDRDSGPSGSAFSCALFRDT